MQREERIQLQEGFPFWVYRFRDGTGVGEDEVGSGRFEDRGYRRGRDRFEDVAAVAFRSNRSKLLALG